MIQYFCAYPNGTMDSTIELTTEQLDGVLEENLSWSPYVLSGIFSCQKADAGSNQIFKFEV